MFGTMESELFPYMENIRDVFNKSDMLQIFTTYPIQIFDHLENWSI